MDVRLELLAAQILNIQAFWNAKPRFRKTRRNVCKQTRRNNSDDSHGCGNLHFDFMRDGQIIKHLSDYKLLKSCDM
jgi:hypothetical protein